MILSKRHWHDQVIVYIICVIYVNIVCSRWSRDHPVRSLTTFKSSPAMRKTPSSCCSLVLGAIAVHVPCVVCVCVSVYGCYEHGQLCMCVWVCEICWWCASVNHKPLFDFKNEVLQGTLVSIWLPAAEVTHPDHCALCKTIRPRVPKQIRPNIYAYALFSGLVRCFGVVFSVCVDWLLCLRCT